eukprot:snap_masked-scaffold_14-processed-gene-4.45-mRNA-1 protein AED:1.00 eAED:1.00 QI:0/0/0/0/1/1/2/0/120
MFSIGCSLSISVLVGVVCGLVDPEWVLQVRFPRLQLVQVFGMLQFELCILDLSVPGGYSVRLCGGYGFACQLLLRSFLCILIFALTGFVVCPGLLHEAYILGLGPVIEVIYSKSQDHAAC